MGWTLSLCLKEEQNIRFRVNYRILIALLNRDSYPVLRMEECILSLSEATVSFS